jgi:hypothetical protein
MAKLPTVTYVLKRVELRWPKITTPDTEGRFADGKFKTSVVAQTPAAHAEIVKRLEEVAASPEFDAFYKANGAGKDATTSLPLKKFKNRDTGEVTEEGFNLKSRYRPLVLDGKRKKLPDNLKIGNGTVANVEAVLFPWAKNERVRVKDASGKSVEVNEVVRGVSMRLNALQIISLQEGGAGAGGSSFETEADAYEHVASADEVGSFEL